MEKLIITAALTGAEVTQDIQPNLPITAEEIAIEAEKAYEAGAAIVHVHAREEDGSPTQAKEAYQEIKEKLKQDVLLFFSHLLEELLGIQLKNVYSQLNYLLKWQH